LRQKTTTILLRNKTEQPSFLYLLYTIMPETALKRATCGNVARPTTEGIDVPDLLAQMTYPAIACEREGGKSERS
jgi:hypothetical protein